MTNTPNLPGLLESYAPDGAQGGGRGSLARLLHG